MILSALCFEVEGEGEWAERVPESSSSPCRYLPCLSILIKFRNVSAVTAASWANRFDLAESRKPRVNIYSAPTEVSGPCLFARAP